MDVRAERSGVGGPRTGARLVPVSHAVSMRWRVLAPDGSFTSPVGWITVRLSSLVTCLPVFCLFCNWVLDFPTVESGGSLYILDQTLCRICTLASILSQT